jgi:Ca2+-binding EF-hand superfamily protein
MMTAMKAENENPALFKELINEFMECFTSADADKDGKLNQKEFKAFTNKYYDCNCKRYGEAHMPPVKEQE